MDLEDIFNYLSNNLYAQKSAKDFIIKIEEKVMKLSDHPYLGPFVKDEKLKSKGYRKIIVDNYILFYLINEADHEVVIMRCLYGGRKYEDFI